jgi:menaquinone-dependent protoporphyrinogen IX oxidase
MEKTILKETQDIHPKMKKKTYILGQYGFEPYTFTVKQIKRIIIEMIRTVSKTQHAFFFLHWALSSTDVKIG